VTVTEPAADVAGRDPAPAGAGPRVQPAVTTAAANSRATVRVTPLSQHVPRRQTNRNLACGNAPSITGKSCDEYPLATSNQGLAAGGTLRTFDGCNINAPRATGPTGASACMITASENNAQGGIMAAFNYDSRVLNGDPFLVLISA
jgi:hypothetical protein